MQPEPQTCNKEAKDSVRSLEKSRLDGEPRIARGIGQCPKEDCEVSKFALWRNLMMEPSFSG
jgi:hypothetical protein